MRVVIFEDHAWGGLAPLVDLRPLWRLKLGYGELACRLTAAFPAPRWWPREELRPLVGTGLYEPTPAEEETLFVNAALARPDELTNGSGLAEAAGAFVETADGPRLLWFRLPPGVEPTPGGLTPSRPGYVEEMARRLPPLLLDPDPAALFSRPWELVDANAGELRRCFGGGSSPPGTLDRVVVLGDPGLVRVEEGAVIEPGVILDTGDGPVTIAAGVVVRAPARLEGPCFIDEKTILDDVRLRPGTSVGRDCRLGGEIEESLISDHVNKHHYGFLGHAYLGEWVNLGAGTTNSDLKNNYGAVRVHTPTGRVDSGRLKVGCFIGDHTKTGIGTLIGTGASLGCFCNLFDHPVFSGWLPPFSWADRRGVVPHRLDEALRTARRAMARRGVELDDGLRSVMTRCHDAHAPKA